MSKKKPILISLYSGAGGIDLGFYKAGFNIAYSTDNWEVACNTLKMNRHSKKVECIDIRKVNFVNVKRDLDIEEVDCVAGGPPCPPYSKSRFYLKKKKRALEDENAFTLEEYFRAIKELNPTTFLFENVHGFIYKPHIDAFNYLKIASHKQGYKIFYKVINAAFFGVPQTRERFFCIGVKNSYPDFTFPAETHYNPEEGTKEGMLFSPSALGKEPWVTCKEAIGDLDKELPEDKNMQAGSRHNALLRKIPPGENYLYLTKKRGHSNPEFEWRSRYWSFLLKLSPDRPSWTIQASHSNNMGPFHWRNRFLRITEIKRIQTFDDEYLIDGDYKTQWKQIGNAAPPLLVKILAESIKGQLLRKKQ